MLLARRACIHSYIHVYAHVSSFFFLSLLVKFFCSSLCFSSRSTEDTRVKRSAVPQERHDCASGVQVRGHLSTFAIVPSTTLCIIWAFSPTRVNEKASVARVLHFTHPLFSHIFLHTLSVTFGAFIHRGRDARRRLSS